MKTIRDRKKNILVISDLHLGEGLRQDLGMSAGVQGGGQVVEPHRYDHLRRLERELSTFLIHYTGHRINKRPWRLIINGDMVDFMSILLFPKQGISVPKPEQVASSMLDGDEWGPEEVFGLGTSAKASAIKMARVLSHHENFFRLLAKFLAVGNDLVVVLGNHDMEFSHRDVQRTFVAALCRLGGSRLLSKRVKFCPWFYYEKDVIYIEHGHQYDEYCSFDYQLCPAAHSGGLAHSFAHAGMRFFGNLVPSYDQRTAEHWGMLDYLKWAFSLGPKTAMLLTYVYGLMTWKASTIRSRLTHPSSDQKRRARHKERLLALARYLKIQEERLLALDAMRVPPAIRRVAKILAGFFMDRLLLLVLSGLLLGLVLFLTPAGWGVLSALSVGLTALMLNRCLIRFRGETSPVALRRVIRGIHRLLPTRLIVFGHSHEAERVTLPGGAVYYNTGTWMDGGGNHVGTHLVVLQDGQGGAYAEMRRWQNGAATLLEL